MNMDLLKERKAFKFNEENGAYYVSDGNNFILDKQSTEELINKLTLALNVIDWDYVDNHNIKNEIELKKYNETVLNAEYPKETKKHKGFIYFIKNESNMVKIGRANDLKGRIGEYTKLPFEPILLNAIESNDTIKDEAYYHEMFHMNRKRGEWFELTDEQIQVIKNLKGGDL